MIDFLICTAKQPERLNNLLCNIYTAKHSGLDVRVTIASNGPWPELERELAGQAIRWVYDAPDGLCGNAAWHHCLTTLEWRDWYFQIGDDDCLLPWGLQHLWENREGVSMVVGRTLCVAKGDHIDLTQYRVGKSIAVGRVSGVCTMFHMPDVLKLSRPLFNGQSRVADFELIDRMALKYKYKIIPNVVTVLALH